MKPDLQRTPQCLYKLGSSPLPLWQAMPMAARLLSLCHSQCNTHMPVMTVFYRRVKVCHHSCCVLLTRWSYLSAMHAKLTDVSSADSLETARQVFTTYILPELSSLRQLLYPGACKHCPHGECSDPNLASFLAACCARDSDSRTGAHELFTVYNMWYEEQKQPPPRRFHKNDFGTEIAKWCCKERSKLTFYCLKLTDEGTRLLRAVEAKKLQNNSADA